MKTSLFDALGGARSIRAVVDDFYVRVLADRALAPFFAEVDLDAQRAHLAAFVGVALGGPDGYRGRGLRDAHTGLGVTDLEFDAVVGHLRAALETCLVGEQDVATISSMVESLRPQVVGA